MPRAVVVTFCPHPAPGDALQRRGQTVPQSFLLKSGDRVIVGTVSGRKGIVGPRYGIGTGATYQIKQLEHEEARDVIGTGAMIIMLPMTNVAAEGPVGRINGHYLQRRGHAPRATSRRARAASQVRGGQSAGA